MYEKRIRIKEAFTDFDRLRKGIVIEDKFRTALIMLNLHLQESELSYLIEKYRHSNDQVNYARFVEDVNRVFEQEKQNTGVDDSLKIILENFR